MICPETGYDDSPEAPELDYVCACNDWTLCGGCRDAMDRIDMAARLDELQRQFEDRAPFCVCDEERMCEICHPERFSARLMSRPRRAA